MRLAHSDNSSKNSRDKKRGNRSIRPGIYLLPNLFTTSALFSGFYGIVAAINGRFEAAAAAFDKANELEGGVCRIPS